MDAKLLESPIWNVCGTSKAKDGWFCLRLKAHDGPCGAVLIEANLQPLRTQSRLASFIEAISNTIIGFLIIDLAKQEMTLVIDQQLAVDDALHRVIVNALAYDNPGKSVSFNGVIGIVPYES